MNNPLSVFDGYKSYIAAAGFLIVGVYYFWQGDTVHGAQFVLFALGLFGVRQSIAKIPAPVDPPAAVSPPLPVEPPKPPA